MPNPNHSSPLQISIRVALRIVVSSVIFYLIFRTIHVGEVANSMAQVQGQFFFLAVIFQILSSLISSYRWYLVMRALDFAYKPVFYLRSYFKAMFFNQGLPTSIGGDALRVIDVSKGGYGKLEAFYGVALDRSIGVLGLLLLNVLAFASDPLLLPRQVALPVFILVTSGVLLFIFLHQFRHFRLLTSLKGMRIFHELSLRLGRVLANWRTTAMHLALAVAIHYLYIVTIYLLGKGVGMEYELNTYMIIVPPVILLTIIPISLAGWGVREGAMVGLFLLIGADTTMVLAVSILFGLVLILVSLPGLLVFLAGKQRA